MRSAHDKLRLLKTEESIHHRLPCNFLDSVVVDQHFNIVAVSQNVLEYLEFSAEEIKYKSLDFLAGNGCLVSVLRKDLWQGSFEERNAVLFTKSKRKISVSISGFYLGPVSDVGGYIILRINNLDEVELINQRLQQTNTELDNFIYRAAHDLRGPLATIKGLINLLKMKENAGEIDRLLPMIDAHANKLDERLYQLVYLAKADLEVDQPAEVVDFNIIETILRRIIEQNAFVDFLLFHYTAPQLRLAGINELLLSSLLSNLLFHILGQPMNSLNSSVFFRIVLEDKHLRITVGTQGFTTSELLSKVLRNDEFLYTHTVNHPQFLNFYAVQKIAWKLKARIRINFISSERQQITILVPIK